MLYTLYDAVRDDKSMDLSPDSMAHLPAPELMTFPSSDGTETLHAALYRPDPRIHGPGPYPLICAVYGGPHVQRVNRSWSQCADMRAQRLRSLGFCVVKCDNRGSSRRGLAFESAISRRLGRLEVLDQVAVVRQLTVRGIADPTRVGIYGWSYGGYLSAMCLCRAPDVFHVAVAGAPVTSWDGYDTHYTERYMGLPSENPNGYRESAVFDHVPNMRGKLLLVHGLIDENVHFRHTARLINRLIAAGKDYDLLLFPDERHSPRRLRDRIYMEQRISDYFLRHLSTSSLGGTMRQMAGL
jgi:dipeptidyl-peptidase-4